MYLILLSFVVGFDHQAQQQFTSTVHNELSDFIRQSNTQPIEQQMSK
jgi:hypothetical protein